jgi:hypothetical protein
MVGDKVVQFVPRPTAKIIPLPRPREGEVDLNQRRGMGVRRDPAVYRLGEEPDPPEAA